jgi:hypothetical protein
VRRDPYAEIHALEAEDWRDLAECRDYPTEWWYPPDGNYAKHTAKARSVCKACPVTEECLIAALRRNEEGIWGGLNIKERRQLRLEYDVQKVLVCQNCRQTFKKPASLHVVAMYCSDECRKGRKSRQVMSLRQAKGVAS